MLFNELSKLLQNGDTVTATLSVTGPERFRLTVHPKIAAGGADTSKIVNTPFAIDGTADELDVELPKHLSGFTTAVGSAREVFASLTENLQTAAAKAKEKAASKTPAKPAPKPAAKAPAKPAPKKPEPAPKPAPKSAADALAVLKGNTAPAPAPAPVATPAPSSPADNDQTLLL